MLSRVKSLLLILPMLVCMFVLSGSEQQAKARANEIIKSNLVANFLNQENKHDTNRIAMLLDNSFGVEIGGCYYQVEQSFDGSGVLLCGTVIVFCQDSVEIYTGGESCS
jgi:hypothetical protein